MKTGAKDKPALGAGALENGRKSGAAVLRKLFGHGHDAPGETGSGVVQLDPVIHERTRLSILTALFTVGGTGRSFSTLRETLSLTDGNLMAHLRTLEEAGLIDRVKEGAGRKSSTTIQLSALGKKAFTDYLDDLEKLLRTARNSAGA